MNAEHIVSAAGWRPTDDFGELLVKMLRDRMVEDSRESTLEDLRSYFAEDVVERIENAWPEENAEWYFYSDDDEFGGYPTRDEALQGMERLKAKQVAYYGRHYGDQFIGPYQGKGNG